MCCRHTWPAVARHRAHGATIAIEGGSNSPPNHPATPSSPPPFLPSTSTRPPPAFPPFFHKASRHRFHRLRRAPSPTPCPRAPPPPTLPPSRALARAPVSRAPCDPACRLPPLIAGRRRCLPGRDDPTASFAKAALAFLAPPFPCNTARAPPLQPTAHVRGHPTSSTSSRWYLTTPEPGNRRRRAFRRARASPPAPASLHRREPSPNALGHPISHRPLRLEHRVPLHPS